MAYVYGHFFVEDEKCAETTLEMQVWHPYRGLSGQGERGGIVVVYIHGTRHPWGLRESHFVLMPV